MVKKVIKIFLEEQDREKLKQKAAALGFEGRGSLSKYIQKVAREPIAFIERGVKIILESIT